MSEIKYPEVKVQLVGQDGNAFSILGRCRNACRDYLPKETWESIYSEFSAEAKSGDYNHLLCTVMDFFSVDEVDEFDEEDNEDTCLLCGHMDWSCTCDDEEEDEDDES